MECGLNDICIYVKRRVDLNTSNQMWGSIYILRHFKQFLQIMRAGMKQDQA